MSIVPSSVSAAGIGAILIAQDVSGTVVLPNWVLGLLLGLIAWLIQQGVKQVRGDIAKLEKRVGRLEQAFQIMNGRLLKVEDRK